MDAGVAASAEGAGCDEEGDACGRLDAATIAKRARQVALIDAFPGAAIARAVAPHVHPDAAWCLPVRPDPAARVSKRAFVSRCLHYKARVRAFDGLDVAAALALAARLEAAGTPGIAPFGADGAAALRDNAAALRQHLCKERSDRLAVLRARAARHAAADLAPQPEGVGDLIPTSDPSDSADPSAAAGAAQCPFRRYPPAAATA